MKSDFEKDPGSKIKEYRTDLFLLFLSIAVSIALFLPLLIDEVPFLSDDYVVVSSNIRDGRINLDRVVGHFTAVPYGVSGRYYRPLFYISYALDYLIGGFDPLYYRLLNMIYHGIVGWLLYLLIRCYTSSKAWAFLSMLIFLTHPIHIEAVSWVSCRNCILAALFLLGTLIAFVKFRQTDRTRYLALFLVLLTAGLLTRETVVMVPLILITIDFFKSPKALQSPHNRRLGFFAPYIAGSMVIMIYLIVRSLVVEKYGTGYFALWSGILDQDRIVDMAKSVSRVFTLSGFGDTHGYIYIYIARY